MKIDMHMHSTYSDGDNSPTWLVKSLKEKHVSVAALTDHDTVMGVDEFLKACSEYGIIGVPGIEISTVAHKEVHILGYNVNYKNTKFLEQINDFKKLRIKRNTEILKQLKNCKVFISEKDISAKSGETIGRMHIAKVMVQKGYVTNISEAFDKFLGHGKKAYVKSGRPTPKQAMDCILESGGAPVLAHPMKLNLNYNEIFEFVKACKDDGLQGIEAYYSSHTKNDTRELLQIASKLNLFVTCGSDYHGKDRANQLAGVDCDMENFVLSPQKG